MFAQMYRSWMNFDVALFVIAMVVSDMSLVVKWDAWYNELAVVGLSDFTLPDAL
jgi:hypothetical protein